MNNPEEMSKGMTPNLPLWSYQLQENSKLAIKTRKDLEVHLITRALKDERFKQELLANPKAVVEQELGTKLLKELEINVLEETENTLYMVLPCNPYEGMSEEELKASLGMTYEDVAQWVLEQQRNAFLDEESNISILSKIWKNRAFKSNFLSHPQQILEDQWKTKIPEDTKLKVFEESSYRVYFVIPNCGAVSLLKEVNNLFDSHPEFELVNDGKAYLVNIGSASVVITSQCGGAGCCSTSK
jgi:hypothetical protein